MRKKTTIFCILYLLIAVSTHAQTVPLILSQNGASKYSIVIPANASDMEIFAGNELQSYLFKIGGAKLKITRDNSPASANEILVGRTNRVKNLDYAALGDDGILIKSTGSQLILTGGPRKGVLYSVYTFLEEQLGCRKYAKDVSYIPKIARIQIPANLNKQQVPSFSFRTTLFVDASDTTYANWHKLNFFFEGWGSFAHTFEKLIPPGKYFKDHPEYFAYLNGKRVPEEPCLSRPEVLEIVIKNLRAEMARKPWLEYWSVSQNDHALIHCRCDLCVPVYNAEGSQQGTILRFVNKVAEQFPDKKISTLAYHYSIRPPKITRPRKNVIIMFSTIATQRRIPISKEALQATTRQYLTDWGKICKDDNLFIWDYLVQFPAAWAPYPNFTTMQPNLKFFKENNAKYLFEQGIGADIEGEFSSLRCYLISKMMWNVNLNFDATMNEFLSGYYGKAAAPHITKFINLIQAEASRSNTPMLSHDMPAKATGSYLSVGNINKYLPMIQTALSKTKGTPYYDRVLKISLSLHFAWLEANRVMLDNQAQARSAAIGNNAAVISKKNEILTTLDSFSRECERLGVRYLNEGKQNVETYKKKYRDFLKVN